MLGNNEIKVFRILRMNLKKKESRYKRICALYLLAKNDLKASWLNTTKTIYWYSSIFSFLKKFLFICFCYLQDRETERQISSTSLLAKCP